MDMLSLLKSELHCHIFKFRLFENKCQEQIQIIQSPNQIQTFTVK